MRPGTVRARARPDAAAILGLIAGPIFVALAVFILSGYDTAKALAFYSFQAFILTAGGSLAAVFAAFPLADAVGGLKCAGLIFQSRGDEAGRTRTRIVRLANIARANGVLALEDAAAGIDDGFLKKGAALVADGVPQETIMEIMAAERASIIGKFANGARVWEFMAASASSWGLIGVVIGLVEMLTRMGDPQAVGRGMISAAASAMYGMIISIFIAKPAANKIKLLGGREMALKNMVIDGLLYIRAGEEPRVIAEKMAARDGYYPSAD
ncbi:MAG: MotA/TolQ/ExbB proton channel family protein [Defluviitaleaceae bacterium]|nr:MotA/TolQ/ExbB proton channel family protein [Defluviitaleaceae bacterium]